MKSVLCFVVLTVSFLMFLATNKSSKAVQIPKIVSSGVVDALKNKKRQNPNISAQELADYGNELIKAKGWNFDFDVSEDKRFNAKRYALTTLDNQKTDFELPAAEGHPCGDTIDLPVLKANEKEIVLVDAEGKKHAVKRPKKFFSEEFVLVDETRKKTIRKWSSPIDVTPFGISDDGTKVYFDEIYDHELDELAVELSEDGTIRLVAKDDKRINKGEELKGFPTAGEISYRLFKAGNKNYIVKFSYPCT